MLRSFLRLFNKHQSVDVADAMAQEAAFNPALARRLRETEIELVQALQMAETLRVENHRLEQVLRGLNLPSQMPEILEPVAGSLESVLREEETSL
ncbi:hypothetical protein [Bdellovibrio sp. HCB2-146]|uniref:hypothetical protein n=1 Tax=Bdellovibrio sp. HCB2-146 TaxID=3394362 RepID=UPI0039BCDD92